MEPDGSPMDRALALPHSPQVVAFAELPKGSAPEVDADPFLVLVEEEADGGSNRGVGWDPAVALQAADALVLLTILPARGSTVSNGAHVHIEQGSGSPDPEAMADDTSGKTRPEAAPDTRANPAEPVPVATEGAPDGPELLEATAAPCPIPAQTGAGQTGETQTVNGDSGRPDTGRPITDRRKAERAVQNSQTRPIGADQAEAQVPERATRNAWVRPIPGPGAGLSGLAGVDPTDPPRMSDPGSPLPDPLAGGSALVLSLRWVPDPVPTQAPTSLAQATQNQAEHGLPQGPCRPALTAPPAIPLAGQASGVTELELDLAELGPVRMRIKDKRGRLALHVLADHPATLELLRRHADELTGSLREAGFADTTLSWGSAKAGKDAESSSSPERLVDLSCADIRAAAQDRDLYILL